MKTKHIIIIFILAVFLVLSGCGGKKTKSLKGLKKNLKKSGFGGIYFNVPRFLFKEKFDEHGIKGVMSYSDSDAAFAIFVEMSKMENKDEIIDYIISIKDNMQTSSGDVDSPEIKTKVNGKEVEVKVNYVEKDKFIMVYWIKNDKLISAFKAY